MFLCAAFPSALQHGPQGRWAAALCCLWSRVPYRNHGWAAGGGTGLLPGLAKFLLTFYKDFPFFFPEGLFPPAPFPCDPPNMTS